MNCLIVVAHPLKKSLCGRFANVAATCLEEKGNQVTVIDLYEAKFGAALTKEERASYYGVPYQTCDVATEIAQLKAAEMLVLVFPTWWFGFPAVLKGWFDRVWAPGHAYDHASDLGAIKPRLKNLKKTYVITTLGSPWWVDYFVMWRPVYRALRFALLGTCARQSRLKVLSLYKSEKVSVTRAESFAEKIKRLF